MNTTPRENEIAERDRLFRSQIQAEYDTATRVHQDSHCWNCEVGFGIIDPATKRSRFGPLCTFCAELDKNNSEL